MDAAARIAAAMLGGFALGSIPFAVIVSRVFYRTDIRQHGSGNPGATNVFRTFGPAAGVFVLALDMAKGAAGVLLARAVLSTLPELAHDSGMVGTALAAIAGHTFSPFIRFRGGKGVATAAGAVAVLMPAGFCVSLATFGAVLLIGRMVSLASVTLALEFPVLIVVMYGDRIPLVLFGFAAGALVFWRHHSNIRRILRGEEPRLGAKREGAAVA